MVLLYLTINKFKCAVKFRQFYWCKTYVSNISNENSTSFVVVKKVLTFMKSQLFVPLLSSKVLSFIIWIILY